MRCPHCADRSDRDLALRAHVLDLLALVEHPGALPPEAALRIAGELLRWLDEEASSGRLVACLAAEPRATVRSWP